MSIVQHDEINSVLGSTERTRWEEYCLELEIASFPKWKRACELWSQPGWISRRVALAVEGRAEIARQQAFAPTMLAPTMAMSLDRPISQPITINLPTHNLEPEPVGPSSSRTSPQSLQQQSGEHAAELTPNAALVQPIAELSLPKICRTLKRLPQKSLPDVERQCRLITQNRPQMIPLKSGPDAVRLNKPSR